MADLSSKKVPVYFGKNDLPIAPNEQKAGNGADLIARYNGLIDEVQSAFDELSVTLIANVVDWKVRTSNNPDIVRLNVYYLNVSERSFYVNPFNIASFLAFSYSVGTDFELGGEIDISSLIQENGCGFYIFLYVMQDGSFIPSTSVAYDSTFIPLGIGRVADEPRNVMIYPNAGDPIEVPNNLALVVNQPAGKGFIRVLG